MAIKCPVCGYDNADDAVCCNLCQNVLRKENQPPKPDFGRRFEGFARFTALHAAEDPLLSGLGIELDYSPASLCGVDMAIDAAIGPAGEAPGIALEDYRPGKDRLGAAVGLGSYYGEVCRRVLGGVWQQDPRWNRDLGPDAEFILARVVLGDMHICPVARAIRRFKDGAGFFLFLQFQGLAKKLGVPGKNWGKGFVKQLELVLARGTLPLEKRAPALKLFSEMALAYDPDLAGDILAFTLKISKLNVQQDPPPLPGKQTLMAAQHILNGEIALGLGRFAEAGGFFEEALKLDPADPRAWARLAAAQTGEGRFKEALDCLAKSLELAPRDAETQLLRAVVLDRSGAQAEALRQAAAIFADSALLAALKIKPLKDHGYLAVKELSPELRRLIQEKLG
ncbi:MAG TPA: tetratricopeptide repeat protein [Elusimicrobiales bacterium]|nr:tetratricopeptide repeat protein [Elusimicrobiales bacterium]